MAFHINDEGEPGRCTAKPGNCPISSQEEHFGSVIAARESFESKMSGETFETLKKEPEFAPGSIKVEALPAGMVKDSNTAILPAGRYFIGDPCYSAGRDDKAWQDWCGVALSDDGAVNGATYNGYPVIGINTAYGDGSYENQNGYSYPVDAGMIGAVPESLIKKMGVSETEIENLGQWVEYDEDFAIGSDGSVITIGGEHIDTDPREDYEDEDEEDPWGDEFEDEEDEY